MKSKKVFFTVLVLVVICVIAAPKVYETVMKFIYPLEYEDVVYSYANENGLDPYLVLGIIKAESNFISDARSNKDAKGLMQITDSTATWAAEKMGYKNFSVSELANPQTNIAIGCWYLRYLLDRYNDDVTLALCSYNAGSGNVASWLSNEQYSKDGKTLENIPFPETRHYVANTQKYTEKYRKLYPDAF